MEKKSFKKYVSFYFQRKKIENTNKKKWKEIKNREREKTAKIEELGIKEEKRRNTVEKKIKEKLKWKDLYEAKESEKLKENIKARTRLFTENRKRKNLLLNEFNLKRQETLDYQFDLLRRANKKEKDKRDKRANATERTIIRQMNLEKNLDVFYKTMNNLKSLSILKKSETERMAMYKDLKRKEEEKKRKEMEDRMEKLLNKH